MERPALKRLIADIEEGQIDVVVVYKVDRLTRPPLGYDVKNRKLVINDAEACIVVEIYRRYLALKSVHALREELADAGIKSKRCMRPDGEDGFEYAGTSYPSLTK